MQVISIYKNRKLFGAFAIGMLVCAAGCSLTPAATAQTSSTAATIEVKLSEYKIDMPKTVPAGARLLKSPTPARSCITLRSRETGSRSAWAS